MNTKKVVIADLYYNYQIIGTYIFLKVRKDKYVLLDDVKSELDLSLYNFKKIRVYETTGSCYVDSTSERPYYETSKHKSLSKIKQDNMINPKNPIYVS